MIFVGVSSALFCAERYFGNVTFGTCETAQGWYAGNRSPPSERYGVQKITGPKAAGNVLKRSPPAYLRSAMSKDFERAGDKFRACVWETSLGVRAKLTLIALSEISQVDGKKLSCPPDTFLRMIPMIGRNLSSIIGAISRLQKQGILAIEPTAIGYSAEFCPGNERRGDGK